MPLDFSVYLSFKFGSRITKYSIITMKVALSGIDMRDGALLSKVKKTLESLTVKTQIMMDDDYHTAKEVDLVMVAGGDRGILDYFHKIEYDSPPVLGIYETDSTGFLAQLDVRELESATSQLKRGNYSVEEVFRLAVKVDGKQADPVLNDVAVFPSKSATLMEHVLRMGITTFGMIRATAS